MTDVGNPKATSTTSRRFQRPNKNREFLLRDPDGYKLVFFEKNWRWNSQMRKLAVIRFLT